MQELTGLGVVDEQSVLGDDISENLNVNSIQGEGKSPLAPLQTPMLLAEQRILQ